MVSSPVRVSFVCSGNICRSPTAEVVLVSLAERTQRADLVAVDSSGTGAWHAGDDMDERSRHTLVEAGYTPSLHVATQFSPTDFDERDVVVALDIGHFDILWRLAAETDDVDAARAKIVLLRAFDPRIAPGEAPDVGDPYYGGTGGFGEVLEQVERSCAALLDEIARAVAAGDDVQAPVRPSAR